jgi:hypothetical protein
MIARLFDGVRQQLNRSEPNTNNALVVEDLVIFDSSINDTDHMPEPSAAVTHGFASGGRW